MVMSQPPGHTGSPTHAPIPAIFLLLLGLTRIAASAQAVLRGSPLPIRVSWALQKWLNRWIAYMPFGGIVVYKREEPVQKNLHASVIISDTDFC